MNLYCILAPNIVMPNIKLQLYVYWNVHRLDS